MSEPITQDDIQAALTKLPPEIAEYAKSTELYETFESVRLKYDLHLDQAGALILAIYAVVVELRPFSELPQLMREALGDIPQEKQNEIMSDFNERVFSVLREKTKQKVFKGQITENSNKQAPMKPLVNTSPLIMKKTVVEQKMLSGDVTAPVPVPVPTKTPKPTAPAHYHGTDPYREPAE